MKSPNHRNSVISKILNRNHNNWLVRLVREEETKRREQEKIGNSGVEINENVENFFWVGMSNLYTGRWEWLYDITNSKVDKRLPEPATIRFKSNNFYNFNFLSDFYF